MPDRATPRHATPLGPSQVRGVAARCVTRALRHGETLGSTGVQRVDLRPSVDSELCTSATTLYLVQFCISATLSARASYRRPPACTPSASKSTCHICISGQQRGRFQAISNVRRKLFRERRAGRQPIRLAREKSVISFPEYGASRS